MSKIIWTNHLRERITQRGLDPSWVDKAIRFPDKVIASNTTDSKKHVKYIKGYEIVAAVKRQGSDWIVTSAWWNDQRGVKRTSRKLFFEVWIERFINWLFPS